MFDDVPDPVWNTSIGKCASNSPAATRSAALRIAWPTSFSDARDRLRLRCGGLDQSERAMNSRGMAMPEIEKLSTRALGLARRTAIGGHFEFAHAVALDTYSLMVASSVEKRSAIIGGPV